MIVLRDWINDNSLINLPLSGRKYIWNRRNSRSKIYKIIYDFAWLEKFPYISLTGIVISLSDTFDHISSHLKLENLLNWGPKPFRYINARF